MYRENSDRTKQYEMLKMKNKISMKFINQKKKEKKHLSNAQLLCLFIIKTETTRSDNYRLST